MKALVPLVLILILSACNKNEPFTETVEAEVVDCCNIWQAHLTTDNNHETAVADFLDSEKIRFRNLEYIDHGLPQVICAVCCDCAQNKTVKLDVRASDLSEMLDLGFTQ